MQHTGCDVCGTSATAAVKVLPCLHRTCDGCLRTCMRGSDAPGRLYSRKTDDAVRAFQCPRCEAPTQVPYGGMDGFYTEHQASVLADLQRSLGIATNGHDDAGYGTGDEFPGVVELQRHAADAEQQLDAARTFLVHLNSKHKLFKAADAGSTGAGRRGVKRVLDAARKKHANAKLYPAQYSAVCEAFCRLSAANVLLGSPEQLSTQQRESLLHVLVELRSLDVVPLERKSVGRSLRRSFSSLAARLRPTKSHASFAASPEHDDASTRRARSAGALTATDSSSKSRFSKFVSRIKLSHSISKVNRDHYYEQELNGDGEMVFEEQRIYDVVEPLWTAGVKGTRPGDFDTPVAVCITRDGDVVVADKNNYRLQVFDSRGHLKYNCSQFNIKPLGVAEAPDGTIATTDERSGTVVRLTLGTGSDTAARWQLAQVNAPASVTSDPAGFLLVGALDGGAIVEVNEEGHAVRAASGQIQEDSKGVYISSLAATHDRILAIDNYNNRAKLFSRQSRKIVATFGGLRSPRGAAAAEDGRWLVADAESATCKLFDSDGTLLQTVLGPNDGLFSPSALAYSPEHALLVVTQFGYRTTHEIRAYRLVRDMDFSGDWR